jgi:hypothetical protein
MYGNHSFLSFSPSILSKIIKKSSFFIKLLIFLFFSQATLFASDELKEDESVEIAKTSPWHQTSYFLSSLLKMSQQETMSGKREDAEKIIRRQVERFYDFYQRHTEARKALGKKMGDYEAFPYFKYGSLNKLWFTGFVKHKKTGCYLVFFQREQLKDIRAENIILNEVVGSELQYTSSSLKVKKKKTQKQNYGKKTKGWAQKREIRRNLKEQLDDYSYGTMEKESSGHS